MEANEVQDNDNFWDSTGTDTCPNYEVVVVGGGISGLVALKYCKGAFPLITWA